MSFSVITQNIRGDFVKKVISLIFVFAFVFLMSSCTRQQSATVFTVNNAKIDKELFKYFAIEAKRNNPGIKTVDELSKVTMQNVAEYVIINTQYKEQNLAPLTSSQKESIASDVSGDWHTFSSYYKNMGISRTTLTKVRTGKEYKKAFMISLYDKNGKFAVGESEIKNYFYSNYVAFSAIVGYLTKTDENGITKKLDNNEISDLKKEFTLMAQSISVGEDIVDVSRDYSQRHDLNSPIPEITVFKKGGSFYPENFFKSVKKMDYNEPAVIYSDEYIFLVVPVDMRTNEKLYFEKYKADCLMEMKSGDFTNYIADLSSNYKIETMKSSVYECCQAIANGN